MSTYIPGAIAPRCTASPVGRLTPCSRLERTSDMNIRTIAAVAALTIGATAPAGAAESRASRGMGHGWGPCATVATPTERELMRHESMGWPTARNPRSTAFGCGQMLVAIRRSHYPTGCPLWTTDVACQMAGMRSYVRSRYGSTSAALSARRTKGWY